MAQRARSRHGSRRASAPAWSGARTRSPWSGLRSASAVDQVDDVVDLVVGARAQKLCLLAVAQLRQAAFDSRLASAQRRRCSCLNWSVLARVRLEYWISFCRVATSARLRGKLAARAPEIDLEGERVLPRPGVDHPLQRRVGDEAAVPVVARPRSRSPGSRAAASRWPSRARGGSCAWCCRSRRNCRCAR